MLFILRHRGVDVPADTAAKIAACRDPHTLGTWMRRALESPPSSSCSPDRLTYQQ
ncbi:hypothetical protein [Nocardia amikacinitolerans]|uniref:hypothetical protein n=1 Tax=Nocardia amikacinitolerans TaxID=756689 RepID=UPI0020A5EB92|nr:hypothetical protein [Nocardia amikacinitolerans]